jgi:hypothetical protein
MVIVQALLTLITKSAGKIMNAMFGWAVRALFGQTSAREQTVLSGVVAMAVAWPLLLLGLIMPKVAALVLAFIPLPRWIPSYVLRIVWLVLVLAIPILVGLTVASRSPPGSPREPFGKRVLRGFPITVGLASAFILVFVSVPVMRLWAAVRRRESANIPLITDASAYHEVAMALRDVLRRHGLQIERAQPGWWVRAPLRMLLWFGGDAFRSYVPRDLEHFTSPDLAMSLYPSGVLLGGSGRRVGVAHALIVEAIIETNGLETIDPEAQHLERQVHGIWKACVLAGSARTEAPSQSDIVRIARELAGLDLDFDQWRALYRQLLQVDRALRGEEQLLASEVPTRRARFAEDGPTIPELYLSDPEIALTLDAEAST